MINVNSQKKPDIWNLLDPGMALAPHKTYAFLRERHPVCQVLPGNAWLVNRYEDVAFALKTSELFSSIDCHNLLQPEWLKNDYISEYTLIFEDPPAHTYSRQLVSKAFTANALANLAQDMRTIASDLADNSQRREQPFDFSSAFSIPYVDQVLSKLVGVEDSEYFNLWRSWIRLLEHPPLNPDSQYKKALNEIHANISGYIMKLAENRVINATGRTDLITQLSNPNGDSSTLSPKLISTLIELIVLGSMEPMSHLLDCAIIHLAHDPDTLDVLQKQPEQIPAFVDELLRHSSPVHFGARKPLEAVELSGITIPAGEPVILNLAAANRDPRQFANPDSFDITRPKLGTHLSFGTGIHRCLGAHLAKMEVVTALEVLLSRYQQISCPPVNKLPWFYTMIIHGVEKLPVSLN